MRAPTSTYRLQLHAGFTFDDAATIAPYLQRLGVGALYLSPILQAVPGSTHGYDAVDPAHVDIERGGREGFERLLATCRELDLGVVLDIVPNHVSVDHPDNHWWRSVLALGRASPCARCFDIDWDSPHAHGRVILPVLGRPLADLLREGALGLRCVDGEFRVSLGEQHWPLRPATVASLLPPSASDLAAEWASLEQAAVSNPGTPEIEQLRRGLQARLARRCTEDPDFARTLDDHLDRRSDPDSVEAILDAQHHLPMFWREGARCVNYRRFFDIDSLAAVRTEDPEVFELVHALVLEFAARPEVHGLRVDHPDGLRDPRGYFDTLAAEAGDAWIIAEKILEMHEALPEDWPVAGTTGYEFMNDALRLLMDPAAEAPLTLLHRDVTGRRDGFDAIAHDGKRYAAHHLLGADLDRLVRGLLPVLEARDALGEHVPGAPETAELVTDILAELAAGLPVYRTYLREERPTATDLEAEQLDTAAARAGTRRPREDRGLLESVVDVLRDPGCDPAAREVAFRFQQFSAPATAKGVEDTAFYRALRFPALNEVGGDPATWSLSPTAFHDRLVQRGRHWPHAMHAGSTHDTKRSEDVRARLAVLTAMPETWMQQVRSWCDAARRHGAERVDRNDLHLLLHTLVGAWPIDPGRAVAATIKAAREARERTSWREPEETYERDLTRLVEGILGDDAFAASIDAFVDTILVAGRTNSLVLTALRLAAPGVPDVYQGAEWWDHSLVDPDNRRPVDFTARLAQLEQFERLDPIATAGAASLWASLEDPADPGLAKQWLVRTLLGLRRRRPEVFSGTGGYQPLPVHDDRTDRCIAFTRRAPVAEAAEAAVEPVPFFAAVLPLRSLRSGSSEPLDATVDLPPPAGGPAGDWLNLADGRVVPAGVHRVADLLSVAPLALLTKPEVRR